MSPTSFYHYECCICKKINIERSPTNAGFIGGKCWYCLHKTKLEYDLVILNKQNKGPDIVSRRSRACCQALLLENDVSAWEIPDRFVKMKKDADSGGKTSFLERYEEIDTQDRSTEMKSEPLVRLAVAGLEEWASAPDMSSSDGAEKLRQQAHFSKNARRAGRNVRGKRRKT